MNKKNLLIRFLKIVLVISIIISTVSTLVITSSKNQSKIKEEVYSKLENNSEVKVIVKLKTPKKKGILRIFDRTEKEKKELIEKLGKKKIKWLKDSIALEINKTDLGLLKENPVVERVSIDKPLKIFLQDSVNIINASKVWGVKLKGKNITGVGETVCVLDTGINFSHPDLTGKNKTCVIDCLNKSCIENCSIGDDNGHGTHVAGIIAASGGITGVAPNIGLIGVKVLDSNGSGYSSDMINALDWCIDNSGVYNISVISMSFGTDCNENPGDCYDHYCDAEDNDTTQRINEAVGKNISVIIATGNNGNFTHISYPACIENATAVTWGNKDDTINTQANRNNLTDFIAPGTNINSTLGKCLSGCSCYGSYMICSGTSMATPHVSAAYALVREYFKLQNNRTPTPFEIFDILNSTGKPIHDSSSNLNFTRIDVYSALVSIDASPPYVNLTNPLNGSYQSNKNISFGCEANDLQLSNLTLWVWNSSGIYNNTETKEVSGVNVKEEFNLTLDYGEYEWNCLAYDKNGSSSFANFNYSLFIGGVKVNLISPENGKITNHNLTFNCSSETETTKTLTNITFYIWNSTSLVNSSFKEISGTSNSSLFSYNFSEDGNYSWNCLAFNNYSESSFASQNFTLTYDKTKPFITSLKISKGKTTALIEWNSSEASNYTFNYGTSKSLGNTNSSSFFNKTHQVSLTSLSPSTTYYFNITLCDKAGNCKINGTNSFTTLASEKESNGGGGGGGGESTILIEEVKEIQEEPKTEIYEVSFENLSKGHEIEMKKNDKLKFYLNSSKELILEIKELKGKFVSLVFKNLSNFSIKNLSLMEKQSIKINLTSEEYYELSIEVKKVNESSVVLNLRALHERIFPKTSIPLKAFNNNTKEKEKREKLMKGIELKIEFLIYILISACIFVFILLVFFSFLHHLKSEKKSKKLNIKK